MARTVWYTISMCAQCAYYYPSFLSLHANEYPTGTLPMLFHGHAMTAPPVTSRSMLHCARRPTTRVSQKSMTSLMDRLIPPPSFDFIKVFGSPPPLVPTLSCAIIGTSASLSYFGPGSKTSSSARRPSRVTLRTTLEFVAEMCAICLRFVSSSLVPLLI